MWFKNHRDRGQDEADKARMSACKSVEEIKSRQPEVERVASDLRQFRDENHFAEKLLTIMQHKPKGGTL